MIAKSGAKVSHLLFYKKISRILNLGNINIVNISVIEGKTNLKKNENLPSIRIANNNPKYTKENNKTFNEYN